MALSVSMNLWTWIRFGLLGIVFIGGLATPAQPATKVLPDWNALAAIGGLPLALIAVIGVQAVNPRSDTAWRYPTWDANFLNFRQPLQFFHFAACVCFAGGAGTLLRVLLSHSALQPDALTGVVMGAAAAIGVSACTHVFRRKMSAN
jgi:hypothetical protein